MRAKEIQSVSTVPSEAKCFLYVHETVAHALFYDDQVNRLILNFSLFILRVSLHESEGKSKQFNCVKWSKMFLQCTFYNDQLK